MSWWRDQAGRWPLLSPAQEIHLGQMVRSWLDHPDPVPPAIERRGRKARDRFVHSNLRLVVSFAERYQSVPSQYHDDMIQAGNLGLMRAVEKFDPSRGYKFSTYAYWWIRQSINAFLEQHGRSIRLPTTHSAQHTKLQNAIQQLTGELGRGPTRQEIAAALGWTVEALEDIINRPSATISLDQHLHADDGDSLVERIRSPGPALLDQVDSALQLERLLGVIDTLDPHAQRVIIDQFLSPAPSSVVQLARQEGVSRETICYTIGRSLLQLRRALEGRLENSAPPACERIEHGPQLALPGLE